MLSPDITIQPLTPSHHKLLQAMMYQALFIPEGEPAPPAEIIWEPNLAKYHQDWGKKGDYGLFAEVTSQEAGAIWCRMFKPEDQSYGFVSEQIPEMVIALKPKFRNKKIGTLLIRELQQVLKQEGIKGISLSVQEDNRALHLYQRLGFSKISQVGTAYTMLMEW